MPYQFPADIDADVRNHLASGKYGSEDDILRHALRALRCRDEDIVAIAQGVADMEAGRLVTWEEFDRDFRAKHEMTRGE